MWAPFFSFERDFLFNQAQAVRSRNGDTQCLLSKIYYYPSSKIKHTMCRGNEKTSSELRMGGQHCQWPPSNASHESELACSAQSPLRVLTTVYETRRGEGRGVWRRAGGGVRSSWRWGRSKKMRARGLKVVVWRDVVQWREERNEWGMSRGPRGAIVRADRRKEKEEREWFL